MHASKQQSRKQLERNKRKSGKIKEEKRRKRRKEDGKEIGNNAKNREEKLFGLRRNLCFVVVLNLSGVRRVST